MTPNYLTIEYGGDGNEYAACGVLFTELNISGEAGSVWQGTFPFICSDPDQRGLSRPRDGESDPDTDPDCDIGAVERVPGLIFFDGFEYGYTTAWSAAIP